MLLSLLERLGELDKERVALIRAISPEVAPAMIEVLRDHPVLKSVSWNQYTPYFMDGDPCHFDVNDPSFNFGEEGLRRRYALASEEDVKDSPTLEQYAVFLGIDLGAELVYSDYDGASPPKVDDPDYIPEHAAAMQAFLDIYNKLSDDVFEACFGDHVTVTVTANGCENENYEHD